MCAQVLTLWQEAKAVVEAWPAYPDALAVSNLVAEELGDESANARLLLLKQVCPSRTFQIHILMEYAQCIMI